MGTTIVERLAEFTVDTKYVDLPEEVVAESKRLLIDSFGCALGSVGEDGARIGIRYGRLMGGSGDATIIGTPEKTSVFGAAFANAELINALDQDAVLPPGHVTPYVLPAAVALAEVQGAGGRELIRGVAIAHEMSNRIGKAMDYHRDIEDGAVALPPVSGFSSTVFGATAAIAAVKGLPLQAVVDALGIAGSISPVNAHRAWYMHAPISTIKYLLPGALAQSALTAAHMAEFGHRGDRQMLDDAEYGYPRFIGTRRWESARITADLGTKWNFPAETSYKPYPHCRILHALLDALGEIVETHDLEPHEIERISAFGESWVEQPIWLNRAITDVRDAQFSIAHGLSVGAHRIPLGKKWQDPEVVFSPSVLGLMERVSYAPHPDYVSALAENPAARLSRVEVSARGTTFVGTRHYPKGSVSPDPATYMTTDELVAKFHRNADGVIEVADAEAVVDAVLDLESVDDIRDVMNLLRTGVGAAV